MYVCLSFPLDPVQCPIENIEKCPTANTFLAYFCKNDGETSFLNIFNRTLSRNPGPGSREMKNIYTNPFSPNQNSQSVQLLEHKISHALSLKCVHGRIYCKYRFLSYRNNATVIIIAIVYLYAMLCYSCWRKLYDGPNFFPKIYRLGERARISLGWRLRQSK